MGCEPCHINAGLDQIKAEVGNNRLLVYSHNKHPSTKCAWCHYIAIEEKGAIAIDSTNKNKYFTCHKGNAELSNCIVCHYYHA